MALTRVWNITDDASKPEVTPHNRMVLGRVIKPGRSVKVDQDRLTRAHKVQKEVAAGFLYVGDQPPASYVKQRKPPKAVVDARIVDDSGHPQGPKVAAGPGHRQVPAELIAEESEKAISDFTVSEPTSTTELEEPEEAPESVEPSTSEDTDRPKSYGRRGKKSKRG